MIPRRTFPGFVRVVLVWVPLIWVVVFWRLGYLSLLDPDEAHYAVLTREMMRARQWLVPLLDGRPFIDKPVLYHWLQTASVWMFGESALALRLPSACAAVAMFVTVRWTASAVFGAATGHRAAVMFATLPLTFALANVAVFDMVYTAFLFGGMACLLVAAVQQRPRLQAAGWPLLALAIMTKGPVALALLVLAGTALSAQKPVRALLSNLQWKTGLAAVAILASPWFVYMAFRFGERFVHDYVLAGNLWYFTRPNAFSQRQSDAAFYARTFLGAFFPWSFLTIGYAVDSMRRTRRREPLPAAERILWTWTIVVLAFFTAAGFKLDTYIFPAAPAVCMLAAQAWTRGARDPADSWWTRLAATVVAVVMIVGGAAASVVLFRINLGTPQTALFLPVVLVAGGTALLVQILRAGRLPANETVPALALLGSYVVVLTVGLPLLERSRPTAPIGRWVARHTPAAMPVGVFGLDDWRASIRYYTARDMFVLANAGDVDRFLAEHPRAFVIMLRRDAARLRRRGVPLHVVGGKPAIVGRAGKYVRRQVWDRLVVTTSPRTDRQARAEVDDLDDHELPEDLVP